MLTFLEKAVLGPNRQLRNGDLKKMTERHPFSMYLNYNSYAREYDVYVNNDQTLGLLWECSPLAFASEKTLKSLEGIFRSGLPGGSVVQFILYADPYITPLLDAYKAKIVVENPVIHNNVEKVIDFLYEGKNGLDACAGIPIRNFRLFVAVKIPGDANNMPKLEDFEEKGKQAYLENIQRQIAETLRGAKLFPHPMRPGRLLKLLRRLFNSYPGRDKEHNLGAYDDGKPLHMQIINAETVIKEESDSLQVGEKYFACITPKSMPKEVDALQTNSLFGGIWGLTTDMDQIKTGFLYTLSILFDDSLNTQIRAKCAFLMNQKGFGTLAAKLQKKQNEYLKATDELEHGVKFIRIVPELLVWSDNREKTRESCTRAHRMWENQGYVMQQETIFRKVMFLSALPFCFNNRGKNVTFMERDFICSMNNVLPLLPVQGDFAGSGTPRLLFIGRKGQLIPLDFFDKGSNNYNAYCAATSGSGKSFLINYIIFNYLATGALIRVIDIGGSYKKISDILGGKYLDFQKDTPICLNPFTHIIEPEEELAAVSAVFAQMVYANSSTEKCNATEENLIHDAVRWAWEQKGQGADSDTVYDFLRQFPNLPGTDFEDMKDNEELIAAAKKLTYNIRKFTSKGNYGRFFNGPSTFDIRRDPFVVLELENLKVLPDLYRVVTLLVINSVTQDLYLSDRSRQKFVIFEEAWQFLGDSQMIKPVVEEGYRRARKYNGSFMIVIQSIMDLVSFGDVGKVINSNSAYKMFLESGAIEDAQKNGLIDYDEFAIQLLKSIKSHPPNYSEIFFDTPFGSGAVRLVVNAYAYFLYTSNPVEIAAMVGLVEKQGLTYHEAILEMVRRRKEGR